MEFFRGEEWWYEGQCAILKRWKAKGKDLRLGPYGWVFVGTGRRGESGLRYDWAGGIRGEVKIWRSLMIQLWLGAGIRVQEDKRIPRMDSGMQIRWQWGGS